MTETEQPAPRPRAARRRRRENVTGGRAAARHVVKVTPEEEGQLARLAEEQRVTVARLLVESALRDDAGVGMTKTERHEVLAELFRLIGALGRIGNNVNQVAKAANSGIIADDAAETLQIVRAAMTRAEEVLDDVAGIR